MAVNKTRLRSLGLDHIADRMGLAFLFLVEKNYFQETTQLRRKNPSSPNRVEPMTSPDVSGQETSRT